MIHVFTTGGTIDKIYHDANSEFAVGDSLLPELLTEANVTLPWRVTGLQRKDSLELTDVDRQQMRDAVAACPEERIIITHGTDTMAESADALDGIAGKTIVLFGAMQPARMRHSDAVFNLGFAVAAVGLLPPGVYVAMNGEVFEAGRVRKNLKAGRFERD
ncbi:asparaginase domain-containing protein [Marinobacter zhanjiangensis]|uniref:Asparaginase n=1 Tax=Marinobacter zhanjiangensis TaxID=578215 RepID=A0ABQ3AKD9_9GAMM|nr:asparaginase domain-containing protein [Marinobacter zhanjiangensis]GGY58528.1 asparaginase [Marinobacter zhanjiangensis]